MRNTILCSGLVALLLMATPSISTASEFSKTNASVLKTAPDVVSNKIKSLCVCQDGSGRNGYVGALRSFVTGDPAVDQVIQVSCVVLAFRHGNQDLSGEFFCPQWLPLGK